MLKHGKPAIRQRVLAFVVNFVAANHYPATYEEIRAGCELSSRSVAYNYVALLARDGLIARSSGVARTVRPAEWSAKEGGTEV